MIIIFITEEDVLGYGLPTVSYTHLDVYKRQHIYYMASAFHYTIRARYFELYICVTAVFFRNPWSYWNHSALLLSLIHIFDQQPTNERLDRIVRFHLGPIKLHSTVMSSCEIAAHAFAKELLHFCLLYTSTMLVIRLMLLIGIVRILK